MAETKMSCDNVKTEKIKAFDPQIVVNKADREPYYMIQYYDVSDKKWHVGYGSFNLSFVRQWLREDFEEVEVEFAEVKHGRWKGAGLGDYLCSECWEVYSGGNKFNYCPNCGAKMN